MTREEYITRCKQRALQELDFYDDTREAIKNCIVSMLSDLGKHPETTNHAGGQLGIMLLASGHIRTREDARKFIEGFN